jgi:lysophospholipase L1-like esterase
MRRTLQRLLLTCAAVAWTCNLGAAEYQAVPAQKIRAREGIGHVMAKIRAGQQVTVAYLGGSITAANGWRPKTTAWLQKTFPDAQFEEIHAAIGGTGSDLGVYRVGHDVLQYRPDLLFVEFAVNDGGATPEAIWRNMEGIVRQTWRADPTTDIVFAYTIHEGMIEDVKKGLCPRSASAMERLADFYGIPSVNFQVPVVELLQQDKLVFKADKQPEGDKIWFAADGCHPRDAGHEIYLELMADAITQMQDSRPADHQGKLAKVFVPDNAESAKMVPVQETMLSGEWEALPADDARQKAFGNRLGQIWMADQPGSKLHFRFKGTAAKLYDLLGPDGGQVIITVDGQTAAKPVPRFDSYCTYHRIATLNLVSDADPDQIHDVTVVLHPEQPDRRSVAFRLKDPETELKMPKYQGTRLWVGQILLLGDLVDAQNRIR